MKNRFIKLALVLSALTLTIACSEDDYTGASTQEATNPSLGVTLEFANTQTLVEAEVEFGFTVTISEPQIVDVRVYLTQIGGDATNGEDFSIPGSVTIPAGSTSASDVIAIHEDDLVEDTETAVIKIATGFESNVTAINSQTVTFNIQNLEEGDLMVGLLWDTGDLIGTDGSALDPTALADLRLLITDVPYTTILGGADGGSFESYTIDASSPDGEYYLVADFYSVADLGDQGDFDISLTGTFDQVGVINGLSFSFPAALNSGNSCESVHYILAKITKTGDNYAIEEVGANSEVTAAPFVGTATIIADDWADYAPGDSIEVEAGATPYEFWIRAYDNPYISNGATAYMVVTIDPATGNATVLSNEDFDYGCSEGVVSGSGTVNACAGLIDLSINFGLGNCGDYGPYDFILQL